MRRRVQRRPNWHAPERQSTERPISRGISIQEVVTILGGLTGIIVAVLWIAGRFYAVGYFGAMNIPSFQTNFSIWEYAELSWLKLIFFFAKTMYPFLVFAAIVLLTTPLITYFLQALFPKRKFVSAINAIGPQIRKLPASMKYFWLFPVIVYFAFLFLLALIDINRTGQIEGRNIVLQNSYSVEVYSKVPLPFGGTAVAALSETPELFHYGGLRLLIFNNGKYYLFREVDDATCKPSEVFVVADSPDVHVVLRSIEPVASPCTASSTATAVPASP